MFQMLWTRTCFVCLKSLSPHSYLKRLLHLLYLKRVWWSRMSDKKILSELSCFYVGDKYWTISVQRLTPQLLGWVDRNILIIFFYPKSLLRKGEVKQGSRWLDSFKKKPNIQSRVDTRLTTICLGGEREVEYLFMKMFWKETRRWIEV